MEHRPVVAIAGLVCETSTCSAAKTQVSAFQIRRGSEILDKYTFIQPGTPLGDAIDWRGALTGSSLPGGTVTRDAFEILSDEIVLRLRDIVASVKLDGLWLGIHGAMCVEGLDDVEYELLKRCRGVIGSDVLVSASMDLHGNVSRELAHQTDLITCYRTAPHIGEKQLSASRARPDTLLFRKLRIGKVCLMQQCGLATRWADEPRNRAVVVVTGWDQDATTKSAETLACLFWDSHQDFKFVAPTGTFEECLDSALASKERPYFISDSGDNPTAGGSGDMTWGLTQLLARPQFKDESGTVVIYTSVTGAEAVEAAVLAGIGATITVTTGDEGDAIHEGPITMTGIVRSIKHGDVHAVTEVVLEYYITVYQNRILVPIRSLNWQNREKKQLTRSFSGCQIVIMKIGYLEPELYDMANGWMLGLTPGGVDQDLVRLGHRRIQRPMWPFDRDFAEPNLKSPVVGMSNEDLSMIVT
ncbi:MlrC C-terminus superfamily protein [Xylariaceae sp. FL1272]|nr:MlrC C-terminus superfamily protein [Xylariaceae sp. FL1272]